MTYAVGDKVLTLIGGKWLPAVITKPPHKETGNYGVRVKAGTRTINTVSSTDQLKKSSDEKVHRIGGDAEKKGAPTDKARAFDKVNPKTGARPNRSVLKQLEKMRSNDQDYAAMDISEDPDYTMVLVAGGGQTEPYLADGEEYYGVNVLFYPSGKVDAATADKASDWQWKHHKDKIIAAAKKALKKHDVDIYRGGKPMKEGMMTFKQFLLTEGDKIGWYVEKDDKTVAGPFTTEDQAQTVCKNKGGDAEGFTVSYVSDFDEKRMNEAKKGPMGVKLGGVSAEDHSFGFEARANAKKTDDALKGADIKFKRTQAGGIFYFHFDSAADMRKAVRLAKGIIDKSEESEW